MSTDDNNAYGDLDKSNLKFIYEQFQRFGIGKDDIFVYGVEESP